MRPVESIRGFSPRTPHGPTMIEAAAIGAVLVAAIATGTLAFVLQLVEVRP